MKILSNQNGFAHLGIVIGCLVILAVGSIGFYVQSRQSASKEGAGFTISLMNPLDTEAHVAKMGDLKSEKPEDKGESQDETQVVPSEEIKENENEQKSQPAKPAPVPAPKPVNTTSCLPDNANQYQKTYIGKTNSEFMVSNGYTIAKKFSDALEFAGLKATIDAPKVVVFAPNDHVFDNNLSQAQLDFMNQSPANMKSVVGWHVITSCVILHEYMEDKQSSVILTTLNGDVTYNPDQGIGAIDGVNVAIWDWFTSNGAVHFMTDFIRPPQL